MSERRIEQHPFEFILKINDNIICQRYFNIHNFNPNVLDSLELKELLDTIAGTNNGAWGDNGLIPKFLKGRTSEYLHFWEENPHLEYKFKDMDNKDIWAKKDNYTFEIKIDDEVVGKRVFSANIYPPKIRYKVNMKFATNIWGEKLLDSKGRAIQLRLIPNIQKEIKKTFSQKSFTKEYEGYSLDYLTKLEREYEERHLTLVN